MRKAGARQLFFKRLAPNDNSKNQVYLGGSLELLNIFPMGSELSEVSASKKSKKGDRLKASFPLRWLLANGELEAAPDTQLILYPQYPEVRISGFLKKTRRAPNALMATRNAGRLLFLGVTSDRKVVASVFGPESRVARETIGLKGLHKISVLEQVPISVADTSRDGLIYALRAIYKKGWITSQRLNSTGLIVDCSGTNCGGYTLEAQLGIIPNGMAEPDFDGWEIKGYSVSNFARIDTGVLTLMTPQPTGGLYCTEGVEAFVRKYGYTDRSGRRDRLNFSSPHRYGIKNELTGLTLQIFGFDTESRKITNTNGSFSLVDSRGREAATWYFSSLLGHWNRKHAKAAYVPYQSRKEPHQQYRYADRVRVGEDTDFARFLTAIAENKVYYDPGIKLEQAFSARPRAKHRSQFRINSSNLAVLYNLMTTESL
jgi:hypothetical protein